MTAPTGIDARQDAGRFRGALGLPSGITVIAAIDDGEPVGLTVASMLLISLDPPMVGFVVGRSSGTLPRLRRAGSFAANVLTDAQRDIGSGFALKPAAERFAGLSWRPAPVTGSPIVDGAAAWIDCRISTVYEPGDHAIVIGEAERFDSDPAATPLAFFRGKWVPVGDGQPIA